jgi:hypothetical protein
MFKPAPKQYRSSISAGPGTNSFRPGFDDSHPSDPEGWYRNRDRERGGAAGAAAPQAGKPLFTRLDISGVNRLTFVAGGSLRNPFTPLLLDPFLKKSEPQPSESP